MTPAPDTPVAAAAESQAVPFHLPGDPPLVPAPIVGRLVRCESGGGAVVDFPGNPFGRPVAARTTTPLDPAAIGSEAVLLFENGDPGRPIVVGVLRPNGPMPGVTAELDGERVVLTAEREIVLRCGEASITLTRAGKVLIRGTYILTRSSGANRIKGAVVEIN
ncbi:MAG TPA: DUF6484 domain-containing protein [Gemmataceae bacterium]|nr:DUF6484 domain-containing protein [Gemmataceae bacterium]